MGGREDPIEFKYMYIWVKNRSRRGRTEYSILIGAIKEKKLQKTKIKILNLNP